MKEINGKFYVTIQFDDKDSADEFVRGIERHDVLGALHEAKLADWATSTVVHNREKS